MSDPYLGEIRMMAFSFAPYGWALCQGQPMAVQQNQALFTLLGRNYGGTGVQVFNLPNLCGRSPVGMGNGAGLAPVEIGETGGRENVTLTSAELPSHTHAAFLPATTVSVPVAMPASTATTDAQATPATTTVVGEVTASARSATTHNTTAADTTLKPFNVDVPIPQTAVTVSNAGTSLPLPLRNPYVGINFCISLQGVFPTRG